MPKKMEFDVAEINGIKITYSLLPGYDLADGFKRYVSSCLSAGVEIGMFKSVSTGNNIGFWFNGSRKEDFNFKNIFKIGE